jgi:hypothetical protein
MTSPLPPAALYVDVKRGPYAALGLDCWGVERDARRYPGPAPVIAHPPCGPWGRYAHRCEQDATLALVAVEQVRRWGGVLEHPAHSRLWAAAGLPRPGELPDAHGGYTIHVEQGWWGHAAPKPTWLYLVGVRPGSVVLPAPRPQPTGRVERMAKTCRHLTPPDFARYLVSLASLAHPRRIAALEIAP